MMYVSYLLIRIIAKKEMKKRIIFEVETGTCEDCGFCPFNGNFDNGNVICETLGVDCHKYDLSTLKLIGEVDEKDS